MTANELAAWLQENGIETVRLDWPDINGLGRTKVVPARRFVEIRQSGIQFSDAALTFDIQSVPAMSTRTGEATGFRNVRALPDLETLRLWPGTPRTAWCLTDVVDAAGGAPIESAPRAFARRVAGQLAALGYSCQIAPELEFYLTSTNGDPIEMGSPCYGSEAGSVPPQGLRDVLAAVAGFWSLEAWHREHGPGQIEVNVAPAPFLVAVDALYAARLAVREAAAHHALRATFMAKPFNGLNGSACQLNFSLIDGAGANTFFDPATQPSERARWFIGGLLEHLDELTAMLMPNANSFRRVVPGHFAPIAKAWGLDNRTAAVRAINDGPKATRVELRVPGADIAAHIAIPAVVAAGLDGINRRLDPGPPVQGNLERAQVPRLIDSWADALDTAEHSAWLRSACGEELLSAFLAVKRQEFSRFRQWVSDFDRAEYATYL